MRYLSICSGIEAASAAWHGDPLNWTPAGFAEIEPFPCAVLKHHYPKVPNLGDMTAPDFLERCKALGPIDVLIGGTPCQAFSVAGLRNSLDDARGNLTLKFVEIVHAVRPAITLWENVPGVLNTKDNAFGCFLAGLVGADAPLVPAGKLGRWTDAGMVVGPQGSAAWRILDAQYFGLAQRRRRCFALFCPRNGANPAEILFESEGLQRYSDPRPKARKGSAADAPASVAIRGRGDGRDIELGEPDCANALLTPNGGRDGMGPGARIAPGDGCLTPWDSQRHRVHGVAAPAPTLATSDGQGGDRVLRVLAPKVYESHAQDARYSECKDVVPTMSQYYGSGGGNIPLVAPIMHIASDQPNAEINTDLAATLNCNKGQRGGYDIPATTHSLTQRHDSSEDGTGRGVPLGPVAPIAFNGDDSGQNFVATEELTNPIRVGQREAVAFQQNTRDEVRLIGGDGSLCGDGSAQAGMKQQNYVAAFKPTMGAKARGIGYGEEIANTVETSAPPPVVQTMQVRRLTPVECERLQGFPDNYTQVPYRNKPAADGPRYKALGNSMAVPVIRWIGQRIQLILDRKNTP